MLKRNSRLGELELLLTELLNVSGQLKVVTAELAAQTIGSKDEKEKPVHAASQVLAEKNSYIRLSGNVPYTDLTSSPTPFLKVTPFT